MGSPPPDPRSESRKLVAEYEQTLKSVKEQHQVAHDTLGRRRRFRRAAFLGLALGITAYLSLMPPAWLKPTPVPPPTPAVRSASDHFAIYLQAQRIETFRNSRGRLPSTIEEAGEPIPGIRYQPYSDGSYALASNRDSTIRYSSHDSLGTFLGESLTLLGGDQR
ncbi:MAG: hypothetical protein ABI836_07800 [Gemmatimonadota bacterium]